MGAFTDLESNEDSKDRMGISIVHLFGLCYYAFIIPRRDIV